MQYRVVFMIVANYKYSNVIINFVMILYGLIFLRRVTSRSLFLLICKCAWMPFIVFIATISVFFAFYFPLFSLHFFVIKIYYYSGPLNAIKRCEWLSCRFRISLGVFALWGAVLCPCTTFYWEVSRNDTLPINVGAFPVHIIIIID